MPHTHMVCTGISNYHWNTLAITGQRALVNNLRSIGSMNEELKEHLIKITHTL